MKGCLTAIGGIVVFLFIIGSCASLSHTPTSTHYSDSNERSSLSSNVSTTTSNDCENSSSHERQAMDDYTAGDYSGGYKNAQTAVRLADSCDERDLPYYKGFALFALAVNEHHLSQGDSETDINQATQLLSDCQSQPGYYGTHRGAECSTAEEHAISFKQDWDMARYENQ